MRRRVVVGVVGVLLVAALGGGVAAQSPQPYEAFDAQLKTLLSEAGVN